MIEVLKGEIKAITDNLARQVAQSFRDMERAQKAQRDAHEAMKKFNSLEETLRYLNQKSSTTETHLKQRVQQMEQLLLLERERAQMTVEDALGKYQGLIGLLSEQDDSRSKSV